MNTTIQTAIEQKKQLQITYNGATRVINPHVYGTTKDSLERLRATQVESNGVAHATDWKLFDATKIESVTLLESAVVIDPAYKTTDSVVVNVIAKL